MTRRRRLCRGGAQFCPACPSPHLPWTAAVREVSQFQPDEGKTLPKSRDVSYNLNQSELVQQQDDQCSFIAPDDANAKEVTKREYAPYTEYKDMVWKSQEDVMMNGAFFNQSGGQNERKYDNMDFITAKHGKHVGQLTQFAGTLDWRVGKPC
ncbi:hypothetical protein ZWY2020_041561 [Hordeum vulgare]|nr:hypothetical protein ZWY2020_041561 [Hordeum vulgare]